MLVFGDVDLCRVMGFSGVNYYVTLLLITKATAPSRVSLSIRSAIICPKSLRTHPLKGLELTFEVFWDEVTRT